MQKPKQPKQPKPTRQSRPDTLDDDANEFDLEEEGASDPNRSLRSEHRSRSSFLAEDGDIDSDDPNLSALFAETGVEERLDELGLD